MDIVSQRLLEVLKTTGMRQAHLAEKLGIHRQAMSRMLNSDISRSKHFPKIAEVLGVSEEYLLFGNRKLVLLVDDTELEDLIDEDFKLEDKHKKQLKDLLIKTDHEGTFFGHELKIAIDSLVKVGTLVIYVAKPVKAKAAGDIYLIRSAVNQSLVVGKCVLEKELVYLENSHGRYLLQNNDVVLGLAVQLMIYLKGEGNA